MVHAKLASNMCVCGAQWWPQTRSRGKRYTLHTAQPLDCKRIYQQLHMMSRFALIALSPHWFANYRLDETCCKSQIAKRHVLRIVTVSQLCVLVRLCYSLLTLCGASVFSGYRLQTVSSGWSLVFLYETWVRKKQKKILVPLPFYKRVSGSMQNNTS